MKRETATEKAREFFDELSKTESKEKHYWVSKETFNDIFSNGEIHLNDNNNLEVEFEEFGFEISFESLLHYGDETTSVKVISAFDAVEVVYEVNPKSLDEAVIL